MKSFLWYVHFVLGLIATLPSLWKIQAFKKQNKPQERLLLANKTAQRFARAQCNFTASTVTLAGLEHIPKDQAVLFVSNHQSNFDTGILLAFVDTPKGFIAKSEMESIPIMSTWMREIRCVFLRRDDIKASAKGIITGIDTLKSGYSMVVFPEGTRSKDGTVAAFKGGSFKLATKSKVPIMPVSISGSRYIMEANGNKIKAAHVTVTVHPPVFTHELTPSAAASLPDDVRQIIIDGLDGAN